VRQWFTHVYDLARTYSIVLRAEEMQCKFCKLERHRATHHHVGGFSHEKKRVRLFDLSSALTSSSWLLQLLCSHESAPRGSVHRPKTCVTTEKQSDRRLSGEKLQQN